MASVDTLDDPRIEGYRLVADHRALEAQGLFVAEGRLVVARLLELAARPGRWAGRVQSILLSPSAFEQTRALVEAHAGVPAYVVPQDVMNAVVGFNVHRGCLALARRPAPAALADEVGAGTRLVVALEGVNNPDNVGGIFRSGAALGADLVALGPACADPLYRKSVRTSMGATLALPFARAEPWLDSLAWLRRAGFTLAALTPAGDARPLAGWAPGHTRVALVAGAEGGGLSPDTLAAVDARVTIPMTSLVDSLNVHTAVAVALYHVREQRGT